MKRSILLLGTFFVLTVIHSTRADLTVNLPNTGEAGDNIADTNYMLSYALDLNPGTARVPLTALGQAPGHLPWAAPTTNSLWIVPIQSPYTPNDIHKLIDPGYYFYELKLNIPFLESISGRWAMDDYGEIFLNSTTTGITKGGAGDYGFTTLVDFNIIGGFTGNDTLVFRVWNGGAATGLLVADLTAEVVPVPSAVILATLGLSFSGWRLRRMKHCKKEVSK